MKGVRGPKDTAYASLFAKEDIPSLLTMAEEVRATHNTSLVNEFNKKCQQKYDDHNPVLVLGNKNIEFLQVSKSDDLVVTAGTNQLIDQILGASTTRFQYMIASDSTTAVTLADTTFPGSGTTTDMSTSGWREYASTTLFFCGIAGVSPSTFTIKSTGIMTGAGSGTLLNRNMFSNFPLVHTVNVTGYVISCILEFCPKM
jgi:hypothetical protein